jgi:uncharacterized protein YcgL (UPF0745 family)
MLTKSKSQSQKSTYVYVNNDAKGSRDKKQLIEAMRKPIGMAVLCIALDKKKSRPTLECTLRTKKLIRIRGKKYIERKKKRERVLE